MLISQREALRQIAPYVKSSTAIGLAFFVYFTARLLTYLYQRRWRALASEWPFSTRTSSRRAYTCYSVWHRIRSDAR